MSQTSYYWRNPGSANGSWAWGNNWYRNAPAGDTDRPDSNGSGYVEFGNAAFTEMGLNGGSWFSIWRLNFTSSAGTRTINQAGTSNGIDLYHYSGQVSKIENNASGTQTFNVPIAINNGATEFNPLSGDLVFTGAIDTKGNVINVYGTNNKTVTISGVLSGAGGIYIDSTSQVKLSGSAANTLSGTTTLNGGFLKLEKESAGTNAIAGTVLVRSGATLETWISANQTNSQLISVNGTFNLNNLNQTLALAGTGTVNLGSATLFNNNSGSDTFSGTINGSGGLTKNGAGTLTLSGSNAYTGATTINAGTLTLGTNNAISDSSAVVINSGGTLSALNRTDTVASLSIDGGTMTISTGAITASGASSFINNGSFGFTGGQSGRLNVNGALTMGNFSFYYDRGAAQDNSTGLNLGADVTVSNGATVSFTNNQSFSGRIELTGNRDFTVGTGATLNVGWIIDWVTTPNRAITKSGAGMMVLSAANTYEGATTINAGTLSISDVANGGTSSNIGASSNAAGNLVLGGGTLLFTGATDSTDRNFTLTAATTSTIDVSNGATTLTLSGTAAATTGSLTKAGSGTLSLTNQNLYTGTTTVNAGTLSLGHATNTLDNSSSVVVSGGTLALGANTDTVSAFTMSSGEVSGGTLTASTYALSGGTVSGALGAGTATVTGAVSLTGSMSSTTLNVNSGGTLTLGSSNRIGDSSSVVIGGGTLAMGANTDTISGFTITSGTLSGTGTLTASTYALQGGNINAILGTGAITVTTGTTTLGSAGRLDSSSTLAINSGQLTLGGAESIAALSGSGGTLALGSNTLTTTSNSDTTFGGVISGSGGALTKAGTGTLILSGNSTYTGATTISAGILQLGAGGNTGNVTSDITNNSALVFNRSNNFTYGNAISGSGSVTKNGSNNLTLSGVNTFSGGTIINSGSLTIGGTANGNNTISGNITVNTGGTLQTSGNNVFANTTNVTIAGGTFDLGGRRDTIGSVVLTSGSLSRGGDWLTLTSASSFTGGTVNMTSASARIVTSGTTTLGDVTFTTGSNISSGNDGLVLNDNVVMTSGTANFIITGTGVGRIVLGSSTRTFDLGATTALNSDWLISGSGGLTKSGTGNMTLNAANTYTGATTINNGILSISDVANGSSNSNIGASTNAAGNLVLGGGTLLFTGATDSTDRNFTLTATTTSTISVSNAATALTISGAAAATNGALIKDGAGTLILSGANAYTGTTTISAGILQIGNAGTTGALSSSSTITNNAGLVFNQTDTVTQGTDFANNIGGSGTLTQNGSGTLALNTSNSYTGATTINTGIIRASNATALGTTAGGVTVASGAALELTGGIAIGAEALSLTGSGSSSTGALRNISGTNSYAGAITLGGATTIGSDADTLTLTGGLSGTNTNLTIVGAGATTVSTNGLSIGSGTLTKNDAGTLTLNTANTYTGTTTINGGTLNAAHANALGSTSGVTVNTGGSLLVSADDAINSKNLVLASSTTGNGTAASLVFSGTYNGTAGSLTLNQNSIIDLGAGSVIIRFSDIVNLATYTLSIYNWTGTTLWGGGDGNNTDQFYVDSSLNSTKLNNISFFSGIDNSSFVGTGYQLSGGSFNNEVIPVPEPETYATGLLLLLGVGLSFYRQRKAARLALAATPLTRPSE